MFGAVRPVAGRYTGYVLPAHTETNVICFQWLRTTSACVKRYKDSDDAVRNYDAEPQLNFGIAKLTVILGN
jgi:hypothetical protein